MWIAFVKTRFDNRSIIPYTSPNPIIELKMSLHVAKMRRFFAALYPIPYTEPLMVGDMLTFHSTVPAYTAGGQDVEALC